MKKIILLITGFTAICIGIFSWQTTTHSEQEESVFTDECSSGTGEDKVVNKCCVSYYEGFQALENAWTENMQQALDQEKATSEKIDDVFEGYNTYKCWGEYLCRAVQFSGYGDPRVADGGLTKEHIGTIPGCQAPEDLGLPTTWDAFANMLKDDWQFFVDTLEAGEANLEIDLNLTPSLFTTNSIPFMPQCMSDKLSLNGTLNPADYSQASGNYEDCMELFYSKFGCDGEEDCSSPEIALTKVETALKKDNADQKASTLENKLSSIITKMQSMQEHTEYLKTGLQKLNDLYECYPAKCD